MGIFKSPKTKETTKVAEATEEKEEATAKKQRLTETEGEHKGQLLNANQGRSVRKIFG